MFCGLWEEWPGLQTHEIQRRSGSPKSWAHSCNYLKLCSKCHDGKFSSMPHASQLAIKFIRDKKNFNFEKWLEIRGSNELDLIDVMGEVEYWERELEPMRPNKKGLVF